MQKPGKKKSVRPTILAWVQLKKYDPEIYSRPQAEEGLNSRLFKAEVIDNLLYGGIAWIFLQAHHNKMRVKQHRILLRILMSPRSNKVIHAMSYQGVLEDTQAQSSWYRS